MTVSSSSEKLCSRKELVQTLLITSFGGKANLSVVQSRLEQMAPPLFLAESGPIGCLLSSSVLKKKSVNYLQQYPNLEASKHCFQKICWPLTTPDSKL